MTKKNLPDVEINRLWNEVRGYSSEVHLRVLVYRPSESTTHLGSSTSSGHFQKIQCEMNKPAQVSKLWSRTEQQRTDEMKSSVTCHVDTLCLQKTR